MRLATMDCRLGEVFQVALILALLFSVAALGFLSLPGTLFESRRR
jgi:hypothetical protein